MGLLLDTLDIWEKDTKDNELKEMLDSYMSSIGCNYNIYLNTINYLQTKGLEVTKVHNCFNKKDLVLKSVIDDYGDIADGYITLPKYNGVDVYVTYEEGVLTNSFIRLINGVDFDVTEFMHELLGDNCLDLEMYPKIELQGVLSLERGYVKNMGFDTSYTCLCEKLLQGELNTLDITYFNFYTYEITVDNSSIFELQTDKYIWLQQMGFVVPLVIPIDILSASKIKEVLYIWDVSLEPSRFYVEGIILASNNIEKDIVINLYLDKWMNKNQCVIQKINWQTDVNLKIPFGVFDKPIHVGKEIVKDMKLYGPAFMSIMGVYEGAKVDFLYVYNIGAVPLVDNELLVGIE